MEILSELWHLHAVLGPLCALLLIGWLLVGAIVIGGLGIALLRALLPERLLGRVVLVLIVGCALWLFSGCTVMIGDNQVGHLAPRGSYRSIDSSGEAAEGLMEMEGGGTVEATATK
jgi:hypothetical protein